MASLWRGTTVCWLTAWATGPASAASCSASAWLPSWAARMAAAAARTCAAWTWGSGSWAACACPGARPRGWCSCMGRSHACGGPRSCRVLLTDAQQASQRAARPAGRLDQGCPPLAIIPCAAWPQGEPHLLPAGCGQLGCMRGRSLLLRAAGRLGLQAAPCARSDRRLCSHGGGWAVGIVDRVRRSRQHLRSSPTRITTCAVSGRGGPL